MFSASSFGTWVRQQRRAYDLTQVELARRVYCAEITIRKIEADQLRPSRELATLIVQVLDAEAAEIGEMLSLARQRMA